MAKREAYVHPQIEDWVFQVDEARLRRLPEARDAVVTEDRAGEVLGVPRSVIRALVDEELLHEGPDGEGILASSVRDFADALVPAFVAPDIEDEDEGEDEEDEGEEPGEEPVAKAAKAAGAAGAAGGAKKAAKAALEVVSPPKANPESAPLVADCPECQSELEVSPEVHRFRCPGCGAMLAVEAPKSKSEAKARAKAKEREPEPEAEAEADEAPAPRRNPRHRHHGRQSILARLRR